MSATELITASDLPFGIKRSGKVRDTYEAGDSLVLVTTDRLSAFDRQLAVIPHKGAVLNLVSAYWMGATRHLCPNALINVPHPNVSVMRRCAPFRVEVVVRAYLTGTTSTSIWSHYAKGARVYCGHALPDGAPRARRARNPRAPARPPAPASPSDPHAPPRRTRPREERGHPWRPVGDADDEGGGARRAHLRRRRCLDGPDERG